MLVKLQNIHSKVCASGQEVAEGFFFSSNEYQLMHDVIFH